jgi:hypothetical protein
MIFSIWLISSQISAHAQTIHIIENDRIEDKNIGIPISKIDFDHLVNKFSDIMQKGDTITDVNDYVTIVRLFNTIYYSELYQIGAYRKFANLYSPPYSILAIKKLDAISQKGLYFYSKKYDLYIGGRPTNNSVFLIKD